MQKICRLQCISKFASQFKSFTDWAADGRVLNWTAICSFFPAKYFCCMVHSSHVSWLLILRCLHFPFYAICSSACSETSSLNSILTAQHDVCRLLWASSFFYLIEHSAFIISDAKGVLAKHPHVTSWSESMLTFAVILTGDPLVWRVARVLHHLHLSTVCLAAAWWISLFLYEALFTAADASCGQQNVQMFCQSSSNPAACCQSEQCLKLKISII